MARRRDTSSGIFGRTVARRGLAGPSLFLLFAAAAILIPATPLLAQTSTAETTRARLEADRRRLEDTRRREADVRAGIQDLAKERERLNARLVETAGLIQKSESQLSDTEARIEKLDAEEKVLRGSLAKNHDTIAKLLAAMQRMGRNPPPVMITERADALKMVRSAMLLASTFPELKDKALELAGKLDKLIRVTTDIRAQRDNLRLETARLNDTRTRLATLMEQKRQSMGERQRELANLRLEAAEIQKSVTGLGDLIARLDKAVAASTGLGRYDQQQKQAAGPAEPRIAAVQPPAPAPPPLVSPRNVPVETIKPPRQAAVIKPPLPAAPPAAPKPPASVVMAPRSELAMMSPGRMQPSMPFAQARGRLPKPAHGKQVVDYGEKTQYGARSKGIVIQTRHSAQITSPSDGWIVYAGEFRSYGQLLIVNAGGGYHILLAGLSQIDVQLGQFVLAGEPVGLMSARSKASSKSNKQDNAPVLYIEFRKEGRPIDPRPWWVTGSQKVQG